MWSLFTPNPPEGKKNKGQNKGITIQLNHHPNYHPSSKLPSNYLSFKLGENRCFFQKALHKPTRAFAAANILTQV